MTPALESVLNELNDMRLPKGSALDTKFEKYTAKVFIFSLMVGVTLMALSILLHFGANWFGMRGDGLNVAICATGIAALLILTTGVLTGLSGVLYGVRRLPQFVHRYFVECIRADAAHAAVLRNFDTADLLLARQVLELQITRHRSRIIVLAGSSDKLSILAIVAVGWAVYIALFPSLLTNPLEVLSPKSWGAAIVTLVGALLVGAIAGAFLVNIRIHRLLYQIELIDLATNTTL